MDINVLWVDTEQGERHIRRVINHIVEILNTEYGACDAYINIVIAKNCIRQPY